MIEFKNLWTLEIARTQSAIVEDVDIVCERRNKAIFRICYK